MRWCCGENRYLMRQEFGLAPHHRIFHMRSSSSSIQRGLVVAMSTKTAPSEASKLLQERLLAEDDPAEEAHAAHHDPLHVRVKKRLPALMVTLSIEMINAAVISLYSGELKRYPLLICFIPVISALGGNVSLQTSAITTRAISHGLSTADDEAAVARAVAHECRAAFALSAILAACLAVIAALWRSVQKARVAVGFGFVVGASMLFASCLGGFAGAATPLLYRKLGMDPASCAGPLDTALQDVLANSAFLAAAGALIGIFGY